MTALFSAEIHSGDVNLAPLGEHYGDWECCMVRIDNKSKQMSGAWLSQHSAGQMFYQNDLKAFQRVNGNQIVVYSSRNGHAVYSGRGGNYTEHRSYGLGALGTGLEFDLRNDTADGGHELNCGQKYDIISADWLNYKEPNWVNYYNRWGPEGSTTHMSADTVANIFKAAFGWLSIIAFPTLQIIGGVVLSFFVKDDVNGPVGPKTKSTWHGAY